MSIRFRCLLAPITKSSPTAAIFEGLVNPAPKPYRPISRSFTTTKAQKTNRMVPDTDFSAALTKPIDVVQQIYNDAQDKSPANITKLVETHFRQLFASPDASAKIPTLSPSNVESLLPKSNDHASSSHRLVRFRAMIQDTGLGTEVFLAKHQHDGRAITGLFGGEAGIPPSTESEHAELNHQDLAERTVM